jgi:hypothetical protein
MRVLKEITDQIMRQLRTDVADLRDLPAPAGNLFVWRRAGEKPEDAA